jgi:hypothetical protein
MVGRNWYKSTGIALVLGRWPFFLILKGHHLGFYKNVLTPLEPKLLVMLGRIVKLQIVYEVLHTV